MKNLLTNLVCFFRLEQGENLEENQRNLLQITERFFQAIIGSSSEFPPQLRSVCHCLYQVGPPPHLKSPWLPNPSPPAAHPASSPPTCVCGTFRAPASSPPSLLTLLDSPLSLHRRTAAHDLSATHRTFRCNRNLLVRLF